MPDWLAWSLAGVLGAVLGSFLNVCVYRWPIGESVVAPRSRCVSCGAGVAWYDNLPVLSWLILRGRCRRCAAPISVQYPLVELTTAILWAAAVARFGIGVEALHSAVFMTLLLGIALTDARHMVIPDQFSLGGVAIGLALAALPGGIPFLPALVGAGVAYALLWLVALGGERLFRKPALGVGDIHMMAMVGAFLGLPGALLTLLLGSVLGLVVGVPLSWWRGRLALLGTYLPLGTFLAMGAAIAHVWGQRIIDGYLAYALGAV
jgi:leader peptidase (prepilin peptidase) / N-methyltransferase